MTKRRLFVAGASGAVGQVLVRLAAERGVDVVPQVRPQSAQKVSHPHAAVVDLANLAATTEALRGCTTVVQLIGTMRKRFASGDTYETSDVGTTRQLVEAAKLAGVDHFVLLSSVGAGRPLGAYLKAKARAEALVRDSGIPFTLFRPSAFEDREGQHLSGLRAVTRALGLETYQPISLGELASALLFVGQARRPLGVALEGPSLWDVVKQAGAR